MQKLRKYNDDGSVRTCEDILAIGKKEKELMAEQEALRKKREKRKEDEDLTAREEGLCKASLTVEKELEELKRKQQAIQEDTEQLLKDKVKREKN